MYKTIVAVFFSFIFMALISAPTVSVVLNSDFDVSILLDSSEEEEKEGKESSKDIEVKILQIRDDSGSSFFDSSSSISGFYSNTYSSKHFKLVSPPPQNIL
jgi:hypothetical protein